MKLELVAIPVTYVDRARDFYKDKVGFNLDYDHTVNEKLRFVQMTPPSSACSICFGTGIADNMKPGSIKGLQMVVKDAQAAHDELKKRGVVILRTLFFPWFSSTLISFLTLLFQAIFPNSIHMLMIYILSSFQMFFYYF